MNIIISDYGETVNDERKFLGTWKTMLKKAKMVRLIFQCLWYIKLKL